jgi:anti-anti-sigma regulatory factor
MKLDVERCSGIAVISVTDGLIGEEAEKLVTNTKRCLEGGDRQFVVDLSESGQIDSGGIGSLLVAYIEVVKQSGRLVVVMPSSFFEQPPFSFGHPYPRDLVIMPFRSRDEAMKAMLDSTGLPEENESRS